MYIVYIAHILQFVKWCYLECFFNWKIMLFVNSPTVAYLSKSDSGKLTPNLCCNVYNAPIHSKYDIDGFDIKPVVAQMFLRRIPHSRAIMLYTDCEIFLLIPIYPLVLLLYIKHAVYDIILEHGCQIFFLGI